jgi:hypothetical protein
LRQADRKLGLSQALAALLPDPRDPDRITQPILYLPRKRAISSAGACNGKCGAL